MSKKLSCSVVMTTFNGEEYIYEQLESLLNQTRKIDEVLIFDDSSKDNTISIINAFINDNKLNNYHLIINESNKGWKRNFYDGMNLAKCDIVFPCDQDDIWMSDKIETMVSCFEQNQLIDVLVGKYEKYFVEKTGHENSSLWEKVGLFVDSVGNTFYKIKSQKQILTKREFNKSFLQLEPGCCFAIKKEFLNEIKDYWFDDLGHDAYATFFSELKGTYYNLNKVVIRWRHYAGSTSRPKGRSKNIRVNEIERNEKVITAMLEYIENHKEIDDFDLKQHLLNEARMWNVSRKSFINNRNIINGLLLIKYVKFYERYRAIFTDWIYAIMKE